MAQQKLSSLSLLYRYIKSDITKRVKPEEIVDKYDTNGDCCFIKVRKLID